MKSRIVISNLLIFLLALAPAAAEETTAVVRLIDGRIERMDVSDARLEDPRNARIRGRVNGRSLEFKARDLCRIEFACEPVPPGSSEQVWLRDGTRLTGHFSGWSRSVSPSMQSDLFHSVGFRHEDLAGVTVGHPAPTRLPAGARDFDVLWTTDGDRFIGRLLQMDGETVAFRSELGSLDLPRHRVRALVLANGDAGQETEPVWILQFANGDRVWTDSWEIEGTGQLECRIGTGKHKTNASLLQRAVRVGEGIEVFSRIQPRKFDLRPRLEGTRAVIVDRAADALPLRIGRRDYAFGLFLRPACEMEYALEGDEQFLLADLGMSAHIPPGGRARLAMAVDDRPWKTFALGESREPLAVALDLKGARRLRLRVEAADLWASGAHIVLGEPVLIEKPENLP